MTLSALQLILHRKGWDVTVAPTLAAGLSLLDKNPGCIILDLMLPDGNGVTILETLRRGGLTSRVIVTTGSNDDVQMRAVRALDPLAILRKPIDLSQLLDLMAS